MVGINSLSKFVTFFACLMSEDKRNTRTSYSNDMMLKFHVPSTNDTLKIISKRFSVSWNIGVLQYIDIHLETLDLRL